MLGKCAQYEDVYAEIPASEESEGRLPHLSGWQFVPMSMSIFILPET
jgi:hypothetical protein